MPESKSRFVLVCQQAFACAVVAAVGVSAVGVVELEIIAPNRQAPVQALGPGSVTFVSSEPVEATVRTVPLGGSSVGGSTLRPKSGSSAGDREPRRGGGPGRGGAGDRHREHRDGRVVLR